MSLRNDVWQARVDLAAILRWSARIGFQTGVCNHYSALVPGRDDLFLLNPDGFFWSEVTASDLVVCDLEGKIVDGKHGVETTAVCLHAPIHKANRKAKVVLHSHAPYATALCLLEDGRLEPTSQTAVMLCDQVAYDESYTGLALDLAEGARVAKAMGDKTIVFMRNHGPLAVGETVAHAFDRLYYLEEACKHQVLAMQTGRRMKPIERPIAEKVGRFVADVPEFSERHLNAIKRVLDREEPDYKN